MVKQEDKFNHYLASATFAHVLIGCFLFVGQNLNLFSFDKKIKFNDDLVIVENAIKVDVVGLPKLTLQELKNIDIENITDKEPEPVKNETPKTVKETSDVEFKKASKKVDLSKLLGNISKKKVVAKKKKKEDKINRKELQKIILEGNKVSKGSSLTGSKIDQDIEVFSSYVQKIPDIVKPYWKLPSYLINENLRARIRVFIDKNGKLIKVELFESSGVEEFDSRALSALKNVDLFPIPPEEIRSRLVSGQVVLGFPL